MIRAILAATLLPGGSAALAQEPTNCMAIHFATGRSSATVRGSVGSTDEPFPCYTLATGKGQTATLKFTKTNGNMAFTIYGLVDDQDGYSFKTEAKTYKFIVFQTLRSTPDPFALQVSVESGLRHEFKSCSEQPSLTALNFRLTCSRTRRLSISPTASWTKSILAMLSSERLLRRRRGPRREATPRVSGETSRRPSLFSGTPIRSGLISMRTSSGNGVC